MYNLKERKKKKEKERKRKKERKKKNQYPYPSKQDSTVDSKSIVVPHPTSLYTPLDTTPTNRSNRLYSQKHETNLYFDLDLGDPFPKHQTFPTKD